MALKLSVAARNARNDALVAAIGGGALLNFYSGARPASLADPITGDLLATLTCGDPFAPASSGGVITPNAVTEDPSADADGVCTHYRLFKADGVTPLMDGDVTEEDGGGDIEMKTTTFTIGNLILMSSWTITDGGA
ncbi:hypothetical protein [Parvibaculum sp. MBR-TMA-1.3b-4.2]|jgi:hypothetical protein